MSKSSSFYDKLIGNKFGLLKVISMAFTGKANKVYVNWKCDCGNEGISLLTTIVNRSKSCGCLRHKNKITHGLSKDRLYHIWANMKARCLDKKNNRYADYGGRGITICEEWLNSSVFFEWALCNGYAPNLTLERNEVNGNYCPENCSWATNKQQSRNTRKNVLVTIGGSTKSLAEWCEIKNFKYMMAYKRIARGWEHTEIFKIKNK